MRYKHIEDSAQGYYEEWVEDTQDPESYLGLEACAKALNAKDAEIERLKEVIRLLNDDKHLDAWEGGEG